MNNKYYYEYKWDSKYCYPKSYVLKNKLNIKVQEELDEAERAITSIKTSQAVVNRIEGNFDFEHLKNIHRFLFEDIYDWAGCVRTVNISKGNQFCRFDYIEQQINQLFDKLKNENYLLDCNNKEEIGKRLAYNAGYVVDFAKISSEDMLEASARAYACEYDMMERIITVALSEQK